MKIVLDEDVPQSFGKVLIDLGFEVFDVRDEGMRGASDEVIFNFAVEHKAIIFTADLGFTYPGRFDLKKLHGLIITRLPETLSLAERLLELKNALGAIEKDFLVGHIVVLELKRIRRRPL